MESSPPGRAAAGFTLSILGAPFVFALKSIIPQLYSSTRCRLESPANFREAFR
jgi:hypothetical protein